MAEKKKSTKKSDRKEKPRAPAAKRLTSFPKGGAGSGVGKRHEQMYQAMRDRYSDKPIPQHGGGPKPKYSIPLIATWVNQYIDWLPFPLAPFVEDFCYSKQMSKVTYYKYLEEDDDGGELVNAHNRLQSVAKIRLIRAGEAGLLHPGIQKNNMNALGIGESDAAAVGRGVGEGLKGAGFFDLYKKLLDKDRRVEQKARLKARAAANKKKNSKKPGGKT